MPAQGYEMKQHHNPQPSDVAMLTRLNCNFVRGDTPLVHQQVVGTLSDGAHQGGGLTAKMPTRAAYSPALANPLTARMGKGINTTLDEGQTPIVCQGEGGNDF